MKYDIHIIHICVNQHFCLQSRAAERDGTRIRIENLKAHEPETAASAGLENSHNGIEGRSDLQRLSRHCPQAVRHSGWVRRTGIASRRGRLAAALGLPPQGRPCPVSVLMAPHSAGAGPGAGDRLAPPSLIAGATRTRFARSRRPRWWTRTRRPDPRSRLGLQPEPPPAPFLRRRPRWPLVRPRAAAAAPPSGSDRGFLGSWGRGLKRFRPRRPRPRIAARLGCAGPGLSTRTVTTRTARSSRGSAAAQRPVPWPARMSQIRPLRRRRGSVYGRHGAPPHDAHVPLPGGRGAAPRRLRRPGVCCARGPLRWRSDRSHRSPRLALLPPIGSNGVCCARGHVPRRAGRGPARHAAASRRGR